MSVCGLHGEATVWRRMMNKRTKAGRALRRRSHHAQGVLPPGPQISDRDVRLLWHSDYWDGPLSGMLSYRGEKLWFSLVDQADGLRVAWYRRFAIVRLRPEELADECRWHDLFRQCVGHHTDYDENGRREIGALHPATTHDAFYNSPDWLSRGDRDYRDRACVGWFQW